MKMSDVSIKEKSNTLNIQRSSRNDWAELIEPMLRDKSPLPMTYDVTTVQGLVWDEYTYTEFVGGMYLKTQNTETNVRIMVDASQEDTDIDYISKLKELCVDKYALNQNIHPKYLSKNVCFMTGHNLFDMVSSETVSRLSYELDDFMVKLHPLTNDEYAKKVAAFVGWGRVVPAMESGIAMLHASDTCYTTMASELCAIAVAFDKNVVNVSNFFIEHTGCYYPINRLLYKSKSPKQLLNNLIGCEYSGIIMPFMTQEEINRRIDKYFEYSLNYRKSLKPISSGGKK